MADLLNTIETHSGTLELIVSLVGLIVSLSTRLAVSNLHNRVLQEQDARCDNCEARKFAAKGEFHQLDKRVSRLETRESHA